jgi:hypothetical protein
VTTISAERDEKRDGQQLDELELSLVRNQPVGGPVWVAWQEGTLTRAKELEALSAWFARHAGDSARSAQLRDAIEHHLAAARDAARPGRRLRPAKGALIERAMSNLAAAEADLLQLAPPNYLVGQMPCLLNQVRRHLSSTDPRRRAVERVARRLGVESDARGDGGRRTAHEQQDIVAEQRSTLVSAVRAASSAALREQLRVRSFTVVVVITTLVMAGLAIFLALLGFRSPSTVPLCFQPERSGQTVIVCPTAQSALVDTADGAGPARPDVDDLVRVTAGQGDLFIVELVGLIAAAVAAASAIRGIRGSSEPYGLPVALAALKLPTGAITAVLGLLLMRGQFVPGLSALDTSAQIIGWALLFGYAQQLFTRLVDQQAHTVLDQVRGADRREPAPA